MNSKLVLFIALLALSGVFGLKKGHKGHNTNTGGEADLCAAANNGCDPVVSCTVKDSKVVCGPCPDGYTGSGLQSGGGCVDVDECKTNNGGCSPNSICHNTAGSRNCYCFSGYAQDAKLNGVGPDGCVKATDLCEKNNGGCPENAKCTLQKKKVSCECNEGFFHSGASLDPLPEGANKEHQGKCHKITPCHINNGGCAPHQDGGFCRTVGADGKHDPNGEVQCSCHRGYKGDGKTCEKLPVCAKDDQGLEGGCSKDAKCIVSSDGKSRRCDCNAGFLGEGVEEHGGCRDINECAKNNGGCNEVANGAKDDKGRGICTNTIRGHQCKCVDGYSSNEDGTCSQSAPAAGSAAPGTA